MLGKDPVFLERNTSKRGVSKKQRTKLALITSARESDLGANDSQLEEQTHLGYLMKSGDVCLGYDMQECQVVDDDAEEARSKGKFPDVVFVRKLYGGVATGESDAAKKRMFRLQRLDIQKGEENEMKAKSKKARKDVENDRMDEEDFMQELEADKEMRTRVNIYKSEIAVSREKKTNEDEDDDDDDDEDDDQKITLDELLDNLVLDSKPDAPDAAVAPFGENAGEEEGQGMTMFVGDGERAAKDKIGYVGRDEALNIQARDTAVAVDSFGPAFLDDDL